MAASASGPGTWSPASPLPDGLSAREAEERLSRFGPNVIAEERRRPLVALLW